VTETKLVAFGVSAFVAGIAGALSGYRFGSVTPEYFGIFASLSFLAFAYMGGISSVTGAFVGGLLVTNGLMFTALQQWIGVSPNYSLLIGGLGLIITVVTNPDGIAGTWRQIGAKMQQRRSDAGKGSSPDGEPALAGSGASGDVTSTITTAETAR
jgi:branched-chain amino acid transport system permease protein